MGLAGIDEKVKLRHEMDENFQYERVYGILLASLHQTINELVNNATEKRAM